MTLISESGFCKRDERLIIYLIEIAENGILRTTHQKIANDIGTSREVVSRLLKDFERQSRIFCSRKFIQIKNL
jgi:CRP/FNR family transcriptional regulator